MNDALKGFLLGFGIGAFTAFVIGLPFAWLLSLFGIDPTAALLALALIAGLLLGVVGAGLALLFRALHPYMRLALSIGLLALGLFLAQPGLDAAGAIGLALTFTVSSDDELFSDESA